MTAPRKTRSFWLALSLICVGFVVLFCSPWAGATAGATQQKLQRTETTRKGLYAAVMTTEIAYANIDNPRALTVMSSGVALSLVLIFSGIYFWNRSRREGQIVVED